MNGQQAGASYSRTMRKAGSEPPGYDRVAAALRGSARRFFAAGILAAACGAGLAVAGLMIEPAGGLGTPLFVSAGVFMMAIALPPLVLGWRRTRRVAFLGSLRNRWMRLAGIGDPDDQIATLGQAYAGLIGNNLRARMAGR